MGMAAGPIAERLTIRRLAALIEGVTAAGRSPRQWGTIAEAQRQLRALGRQGTVGAKHEEAARRAKKRAEAPLAKKEQDLSRSSSTSTPTLVWMELARKTRGGGHFGTPWWPSESGGHFGTLRSGGGPPGRPDVV